MIPEGLTSPIKLMVEILSFTELIFMNAYCVQLLIFQLGLTFTTTVCPLCLHPPILPKGTGTGEEEDVPSTVSLLKEHLRALLLPVEDQQCHPWRSDGHICRGQKSKDGAP